MASQFSISAEAAIDSLVRALHEWLIQLTWYVGCEVTDVSEVDAGWVTCRISGGTNQRCRWRKLFAIAVGDFVDVLYDPKSMTWEVFKPGGAAAWYSTGFNVDQDSIRFEYTNNSTGTLTLGEVVVFDSTQDLSVTTTTTLGDTTVAGAVVVGNVVGALVQVAQLGVAHVQVDGNVTRGQFLKTSTARGLATPTNTEEEGVFGIALTPNTAGSTGTVQAFLVGHSWDGPAAGGAAHNILSVTHTDTTAAGVVIGDLMSGQAGPAWARLGIGGAGNVLTVVGGVPAWQAPAAAAHNILSATHSDTPGAAGVVQGDVLRGDGTPDWNRLVLGTQGFFFKSDGTDADWRRISTQTCTVGPGTTCEATTLGAAVTLVNAAGPPTAANPWVIRMYSGVYTEVGNITIPANCRVVGMEGVQINMGTGNDITFSADSGMESCYVYGDPTAYLLGTTAVGVVWRNVRANLTGAAGWAFDFQSTFGVEAWHCIAESDTSGVGHGFYMHGDGTGLLYDCRATDMEYGFRMDNYFIYATTIVCEFLDNAARDIYQSGGGSQWEHFQCRSMRNQLAAAATNQSHHTYWPNGDYMDLDFTGTDWDLKGECNLVGLRFSDVATPFPTILNHTVAGTWAHVGAAGWAPTFTVTTQGPAILIPIMRPGNWELDIDFSYVPTNVNQRFILYLGYIANSNHVGACGMVRDGQLLSSNLDWFLYTNDGNDVFTQRYAGAPIVGATGNYEIRFRCVNGCVGVYDDQNNTWNYYAGRQNTGASPYSAYTAAHAYLQFYCYDANVPPLRIRNLSLTYLS